MSRELGFLLSSVYNNNLYKTDTEENNLRRSQQQQNIRESSYQNDNDTNPYLYILNKLSQNLGTTIQPRDLAYLKELGVQPVNRMFVLRRWTSGPLRGPNVDIWSDPYYSKEKPVSVVVGWIPDEELFNISVKEGWTTSKELIHQVIGNILKEFGIKGEKIASVPGWSQGLMIRLLQRISGNEISSNQIMQYFGNPNVLMEGATRGTDWQYNLSSTFQFQLKTTYEAKYIYDIDPVDAMKSIIDNLLSMGSQPEVHFRLGKKVEQIAELATADASTGWIKVKEVILDFLQGIKEMITEVTDVNEDEALTITEEDKKEAKKEEIEGKKYAREPKKSEEESTTRNEAILETEKDRRINPDNLAEKSLKDGGKIAYLAAEKTESLLNKVLQSTFMQDVFAITVAKYRHNFRGTYGLHTGVNTTPWHLTIGNPLSPVLSMNNIIVTDVSIKGKNNFTYNDIPEEVEATISVQQSRNMGTQKISEMFFRKHIRTYASSEILDRTIANQNPIFVGNNSNYWDNVPNEEKYEAMRNGIDGMGNTPDNPKAKDQKTSANTRQKE